MTFLFIIGHFWEWNFYMDKYEDTKHIMETEETYVGEYNKDNGDIGLFEWGQI